MGEAMAALAPTGGAMASLRRRTGREVPTGLRRMDSSRHLMEGGSTARVAARPTATGGMSSSTLRMARPRSTQLQTISTFRPPVGAMKCLHRRGGDTTAALARPLPRRMPSTLAAPATMAQHHPPGGASGPRRGLRWTSRWTRSRRTRTMPATLTRHPMVTHTSSRSTRGRISRCMSSRSSLTGIQTRTMRTRRISSSRGHLATLTRLPRTTACLKAWPR
mmetsp:Transcript_2525/g.6048  ORF Transcript_2525/g.6048 Transcript_2525/m.6048 type:complete len:220 (+) Transcript_2525:86-745(+)